MSTQSGEQKEENAKAIDVHELTKRVVQTSEFFRFRGWSDAEIKQVLQEMNRHYGIR